MQGHFWNQREELELALESAALCAQGSRDGGGNGIGRGGAQSLDPMWLADFTPLQRATEMSKAHDCPREKGGGLL